MSSENKWGLWLFILLLLKNIAKPTKHIFALGFRDHRDAIIMCHMCSDLIKETYTISESKSLSVEVSLMLTH